MLHNYASCPSIACNLCDAYGDGYSRGKASAVFEILNVGTDHLSGCGCTPCKVRRTLQLDGGPELPRITPDALEAPAIAEVGPKTTL